MYNEICCMVSVLCLWKKQAFSGMTFSLINLLHSLFAVPTVIATGSTPLILESTMVVGTMDCSDESHPSGTVNTELVLLR